MPKVYDWNGSAATQIKKIYDWNGSAATQIKKGYDNNGTTSSLVYNAQSPQNPYILNYNDQVSSVTGGWTLDNTDGYEYLQGYNSGTVSNNDGTSLSNGWMMSYSGNNSGGHGWMYTNNAIQISGWNKLVLYFGCMGGYGDANRGTGTVRLRLFASKPSLGNTTTIAVKAATYTSESINGETGQWLILDVSALNGSYYVRIDRRNSTSGWTFTTCFYTLYFEM